MKKFKKEDGYTLLELVIVVGFIGMVMFFLLNGYVTVHKNYLRSENKARNLEEARLIINQIDEDFRKIGNKTCKITIQETNANLGLDDAGTVKEIKLEDSANPGSDIVISYNPTTKRITRQTVELVSDISNFKVVRNKNLITFTLEVEKEGHNVIEDQTIEVSTTVNLQYTG